MSAAPDYAELLRRLRFHNSDLTLEAADAIDALVARVADLDLQCDELGISGLQNSRDAAHARIAALEAENRQLALDLQSAEARASGVEAKRCTCKHLLRDELPPFGGVRLDAGCPMHGDAAKVRGLAEAKRAAEDDAALEAEKAELVYERQMALDRASAAEARFHDAILVMDEKQLREVFGDAEFEKLAAAGRRVVESALSIDAARLKEKERP